MSTLLTPSAAPAATPAESGETLDQAVRDWHAEGADRVWARIAADLRFTSTTPLATSAAAAPSRRTQP